MTGKGLQDIAGLVEGLDMRPALPTAQGAEGFTTGVGLIALAAGLVVTALLLMLSLDPFSGSSSGDRPAGQSILSRSSTENQIKLCAEGRDSTYGNPPSDSQQAWCVNQLAGQLAGGGAPEPGFP